MKNALILALFAAMPLMAQDCPENTAEGARQARMHKMQRGGMSDEQKAERKAKFEARKAEMLSKYDTDKDGKLSAEERKAARAEAGKRGNRRGQMGGKGRRGGRGQQK